jgi:hypothetical protein
LHLSLSIDEKLTSDTKELKLKLKDRVEKKFIETILGKEPGKLG